MNTVGFNCLKTAETLRGDSLLLITKSPRDFGTHLVDLGGMES